MFAFWWSRWKQSVFRPKCSKRPRPRTVVCCRTDDGQAIGTACIVQDTIVKLGVGREFEGQGHEAAEKQIWLHGHTTALLCPLVPRGFRRRFSCASAKEPANLSARLFWGKLGYLPIHVEIRV